MSMTGRCLCGAVSFRAQDVDGGAISCHCDQCRRWTGTSMMGAEVGRVEFAGEEHIRRYDSSSWAERGFCRECGASLFYRHKAKDRYFVSLGMFDDQSSFRLAVEIYMEEKPPGYDFAGDHPRRTSTDSAAPPGGS